MNEEQSGAASEGESVTPRGPSWFGRLRAQPGFRTAAIAFCLTVVLGIGGSAAYAYWSLRADADLVVATARPALPAVGKPSCRQFTSLGVVYMDYARADPALLPSDALILVNVSVKGRDAKKSFLVGNTGSFELRDLPDLGDFIGPSLESRTIYVELTTAYVDPIPTRLPAAVTPSTKITDPMPAAGVEEARFRASFFC